MGKVARRTSTEKQQAQQDEDPTAKAVVDATVPDTAGHSATPSSAPSSGKVKAKKSRKKVANDTASGTTTPPAPVPPPSLDSSTLSVGNDSSALSSTSTKKKLRKKSSLDKATDVVATTESKKATKKKNNSISQMDARDIPVPTSLERNTSRPGAFRQAGMDDEDIPPDIDPPQEGTTTQATSPPVAAAPAPEAPLLTATLVEEDEEKASPMPVAVVARAEPLDDDDEEANKASPAPPTSNRKLYCLVLLLALLCCIAVGVIVGITMGGGGGGDGSGDANSNVPAEDENTTDPEVDDGDDDNMHRVHYVVEWGFGVAGCKGGVSMDLEVSCSATEITLLDAFDAECERVGNLGRSLKCTVPGTSIDVRPDDGPKRWLQTVFADDPRAFYGSILVACDGSFDDSNQDDFAMKSTVFKPREPIDCGFTWISQPNEGTALPSMTRVMGGAIASVVSGSMLCPSTDVDGESIMVHDIECSLPGQADSTFEDTEEGVVETSFCGDYDMCYETRDNCLANPDTDPCRGVTCEVDILNVRGNLGGDPCLIPMDEAESDPGWSVDVLWEEASGLASPEVLLGQLFQEAASSLQNNENLFDLSQ